MTYNITADSVPDLDDWGIDDYWTCSDWTTWHTKMKDKFGKQVANQRFLAAWEQQTFGAHAIDCRSFNTAFRDYARANGFFDALYSGIGVIAQPIGVGTDLVSATGETISSIGKGVSRTAKVTSYILPAVIIIVAAFGLAWFYKKFVVQTAAAR